LFLKEQRNEKGKSKKTQEWNISDKTASKKEAKAETAVSQNKIRAIQGSVPKIFDIKR
jgi:hypothetical protein